MDSVARATLATVAYFDLFQVPLTALEAWRNLFWLEKGIPPGLGDVETAIARLVADGVLVSQEGYVSLPGGAQASVRLIREADALRKWRRLRFGARLLSAVPFLTGIAAVNTLPIGAARRDSDIDVLLVARAGRLYTMRFIAVALATVFGLYRSGTHVADRLCLSFSVSDRALGMAPLAKAGGDPYLQFWAANVHVVAERGRVFDAFWRANAPLLAALPNARLRRLPHLARPLRVLALLRDLAERLLAGSLGDRVERWSRDFQMRRFAANTGSRARRGGTDVVITEDMLKFHERDRREEVRLRWAQKRAALGV